ncbi:MAG: VCBS repeat-containing protein [Myxococcota bacterium]
MHLSNDRRLYVTTALAGPAGLLLGLACADPSPSTLNQKCFHDEDCDAGQFCERLEANPDGLCRTGENGSSSDGAADGNGPTSGTSGAVDPTSGGAEDPSTSDTGNPVTATGTGTSGPGESTDDTSTTTSATTSETTGSSGGPACGDGSIDPDEMCFDAPLLVGAGSSVRGVAVGDLDEDGHADVVATTFGNGSNGGALRFLGEGDGSFDLGQAVDLGTGGYERVAVGAIADLDVDICAVDSAQSQVACVRGDGNGAFGSATTTPGGDFDIVLADFDGSSYLDFVTVSDSEFIVGFEGNFSENFPATADWLQEDGISFPILGMASADFNGDDNPDLVITNPNANVFRVLLTDGSSGTSPITTINSFGAVAGPVDATVGDFDGDGDLDVAVAVEERVSLRLGSGDGINFGIETVLDVDEGTVGIVAVDLDLDGMDDIVTANDSGTVSILRSIDGTLFDDQISVAVPGAPTDLAVADFNEDTLPDVVIAAGAGVQVLLSAP